MNAKDAAEKLLWVKTYHPDVKPCSQVEFLQDVIGYIEHYESINESGVEGSVDDLVAAGRMPDVYIHALAALVVALTIEGPRT